MSDITDTEQWIVRSSMDERWGKDKIDKQIVEVEARPDPADRELTD